MSNRGEMFLSLPLGFLVVGLIWYNQVSEKSLKNFGVNTIVYREKNVNGFWLDYCVVVGGYANLIPFKSEYKR